MEQPQGDQSSETSEREKDLSLLGSLESELSDLESALGRIDDGSYGACESCGKPIPADRLEAVPATRFCADDEPLR